MSFLTEIILTQFRNFTYQKFIFPSNIIGITGKNGIGKTNLLDAIYYLCHTKSYFNSRELNNVQNNTSGFRLEGIWQKNEELEKTILIWKEGKKILEHDGIPYSRIMEHIGKFNAVMIAPDDIDIINGGSENRRKFFDGLLSQSDPVYLQNLLSYQKTLQQKNALLKSYPQQISQDLLDIYDEQLSLSGSYLIFGRQKAALKFPALIQKYYHVLSEEEEVISLEYRASCAAEELKELLLKHRCRDIEAKRTTIGPHTEEWLFKLRDNSLKTHASQGQKKSYLISLKLAHVFWLQQLNCHPILLLDDIFEKLDQKRLRNLFYLLNGLSIDQIFMTHTYAKDLKQLLSLHFKYFEILELIDYQ